MLPSLLDPPFRTMLDGGRPAGAVGIAGIRPGDLFPLTRRRLHLLHTAASLHNPTLLAQDPKAHQPLPLIKACSLFHSWVARPNPPAHEICFASTVVGRATTTASALPHANKPTFSLRPTSPPLLNHIRSTHGLWTRARTTT
ncbi:hypothetical protein LINPERHAP2_LOCUS16562 [Linum perenne]